MFTAVLPPEGVMEELDAILEPRRAVSEGVRWTKRTGWHLTTSFMADVDGGKVERLVEHLGGVAAGASGFDLRLGGGLSLPNPARARVVALGVERGAVELEGLSAGARRAASRSGVPVDGARFLGHLTLARSRAGINAVRWLQVLDSFPSWSWTVKEFVLIESHEVGRRYEQVAWFPLGLASDAP